MVEWNGGGEGREIELVEIGVVAEDEGEVEGIVEVEVDEVVAVD